MYDELLVKIADYVTADKSFNQNAYDHAQLCLVDALACSFLALRYPECDHLLGPEVNGEFVDDGVRVPGTHYVLPPVEAAFNIGTAIRWLDFNDTWLAAEWGHPSDNIGGILAVADYLSRFRKDHSETPLTVKDILTYIIKAYEIQGVLALSNAFNRIGLDHVILVKLATAAIATHMLGGDHQKICDALSQVFVDGQALRTYRHQPNTGSRKSWAAGDATSRGVWLASITMRGEKGYPSALTAKEWGFHDVYFGGKPVTLEQALESFVVENILFKVGFPAEFHGQTAVEAALQLHPEVNMRWEDIKKVSIRTQESAMRIINKQGQLLNPAARDHCLQYMVAAGLIWGELKSDHYHDHRFVRDSRLDDIREKTEVTEDKQFSKDYLDPAKRSIANAVQIEFNDGTKTDEVIIEYPLGHAKRRDEAKPQLDKKFRESAMTTFKPDQYEKLFALVDDQKQFAATSVDDLMSLLVK